MKLLFVTVCLIAGIVAQDDTLSCEEKKANCAPDVVHNCNDAEAWKDCIEALQDECDLHTAYTIELAVAEAATCFGRPMADTVTGDYDEACEEKKSNCAPAQVNSCDDTQAWKACLEGLKEECNLISIYTIELAVAETSNCLGAVLAHDEESTPEIEGSVREPSQRKGPGKSPGKEQGNEQGKEQAKEQAKEQGKEQGKEQAKEQGNEQGKEQGNEQGNEQGKEQGNEQGKQQGKDQRKEEGKDQGKEQRKGRGKNQGKGQRTQQRKGQAKGGDRKNPSQGQGQFKGAKKSNRSA